MKAKGRLEEAEHGLGRGNSSEGHLPVLGRRRLDGATGREKGEWPREEFGAECGLSNKYEPTRHDGGQEFHPTPCDLISLQAKDHFEKRTHYGESKLFISLIP